MKLAFVSGPYRAKTINEIHDNIEQARHVAIGLWRLGYAVHCPHTGSAYMDGVVPDEVFLAGDIEILKRCDLVVMVPEWRHSSGSREEYAVAREHGIPVFDWDNVPGERYFETVF